MARAAEPHTLHLLSSTILRGGRLARRKGMVASFAPALGAAAVLGSLALPDAAVADVVWGNAESETTQDDSASAGFEAFNGAGSITITALGSVIGTAPRDGILAINADYDSANVTVIANIVNGFANGITAGNNSDTGHITITSTTSVTGQTGAGICAGSRGGNLSVTANNVTAGTRGILAKQYGSGGLTISTSGTIVASTNVGIEAINYSGSSLSITQAASTTLTAGGDGILVKGFSGSSTINALGTVNAPDGTGILADNAGNPAAATDLTITSHVATGRAAGIRAVNYGAGATTITSTGSATGDIAAGAYASNTSRGTSMALSVNDANGVWGVKALHRGTQALTLAVTGDVVGTSQQGVFAHSYSSNPAASMTINQAAGSTITGAYQGIIALNEAGALTVETLGTVVGDANYGIVAINRYAATDLVVTASEVTGATFGISANNFGSGTTIVTSTTSATGGIEAGIRAINSTYAGKMAISALDVSGAVGIEALQSGTGPLTISATGAVTGTSSRGIFARNFSDDSDTFTTVNQAGGSVITGAMIGMDVANYNGALTVSAAGNVVGLSSYGILARNASSSATDLVVTAAHVSGNEGIGVRNAGRGATTVTSTGSASGGGRAGIRAFSNAAATTMAISAKDVDGAAGIQAVHGGTGPLTISTTGTVTGTAGIGIQAINYSTNPATLTTVTQAAGSTISGSATGIEASNYSGNLTVDALGTVAGSGNYAIWARNASPTATDLVVTSAEAAGNLVGLFVQNWGSGVTTVTSSTSATATIGAAIQVQSGTHAGATTITARNTAGNTGISASHGGTGALTITSLGTASGNGAYGIFAENSRPTSTDLIVSAAEAAGAVCGINVNNIGSGVTAVTSTIKSTGGISAGICASNSTYSTAMAISAVDAIGTSGIVASNFGTAGLTVSTSGFITGTAGAGISTYNSAHDTSGSQLIDQAAGTTIAGMTSGIVARNAGGSLTINSLGTVVGTTSSAIIAENNGPVGTSLTLTSFTAEGGQNGIVANNQGTGALTLTSTGAATGATGSGIHAANTGTSLTIAANDAAGSVSGIYANNTGSGATSIALAGTAQGGTGAAIDVVHVGTSVATVELAGTAQATAGSSGTAIHIDAGTNVLNVANGGRLTGRVTFSPASSSTVTLAGVNAVSDLVQIDGGDDLSPADNLIDRLTLTDMTATLAGANFPNWESITIGNRAAIGFSDGAIASSTAAGHGLIVAAGGTLDARSGALTVNANLTNAGVVTLADGTPYDLLTVNGNFAGTGVVALDANLDLEISDTLVISGDVTSGSTVVKLTTVGNTGTVTGTDDGILLIEVGGTAAADAFTLDGGALDLGLYRYTMAQQGDGNFYLTSNFSTAVSLLESVSAALLTIVAVPSLQGRTGHRLWAPGSSNAGTGTGIWGTIEASTAQYRPGSSATASMFDQDQWKARIGADLPLLESAAGRLVAGLFGQYGTSDTKVTSARTLAGKLAQDLFGGGVSATWFGTSGLYADGQVHFNVVGTDIYSDAVGSRRLASSEASGLSGSAELGFRLGSDRLSVTPQVQVSYSELSYDGFGALGATIVDGKAQSLRGRIGLEVESVNSRPDGFTTHFYSIVNLTNEFENAQDLRFDETRLVSNPEPLWGEGTIGVTHKFSQRVSVFGEGGYAAAFANSGDNFRVSGRFGLSVVLGGGR